MDNSTSILDLPTDPIGNNSTSNNISIVAHDTTNPPTEIASSNSGMTLDQTTINQIINGLQQASISGATQLPSRDIPMNTNNVSIDPQTMPNYVPPIPASSRQSDYITNYEQSSEIIQNYNKNKINNNSLDRFYDEIHAPLLLIILYFFFQLPFLKKSLNNYIPFLFSNDGNYNINGYLFTSMLFGSIYYVIMKILSFDVI